MEPGERDAAGRVRVGTSGWTYKHWRGTFYPDGLRVKDQLHYFTARFPTVELNGSYYRWPTDEAFAAWREKLPAGFEMAVKASRYLTHYAKLHEPGKYVDAISTAYEALGDRAGPLLLQLPSNLARNDERLASFLRMLPANVRPAVEFQHDSWLHDDVFDLLDQLGAGFVVSVIAGREPILRSTGRLAYVRFHNADPRHRYGGSFSDDALRVWADRLRELTLERPGYVYFNNDNYGNAAFNAQTLQHLLAHEPPLTW